MSEYLYLRPQIPNILWGESSSRYLHPPNFPKILNIDKNTETYNLEVVFFGSMAIMQDLEQLMLMLDDE